MTGRAPKAELLRYLQAGRDALVWKTEGLGEYDLRRPMTPTGTNLLGLVKHVAACEMGYLGAVFGRPIDEPQPWFDDDADPAADMFATADESPADIVALHRRVRRGDRGLSGRAGAPTASRSPAPPPGCGGCAAR